MEPIVSPPTSGGSNNAKVNEFMAGFSPAFRDAERRRKLCRRRRLGRKFRSERGVALSDGDELRR
jgi:hypothetical protein